MATATKATPDAPKKTGVERPSSFIPTPERISQFLEIKTEEVTQQMQSVEGRQSLYKKLIEHQADLKKAHVDFNPEQLHQQLELAGETLATKRKFLNDVKNPEKKSIFGRVWSSVKGFAKNHPVVTTLLVAAAATAAVAGGFWLAGQWELLMNGTGLAKIFGSAKAASELVPPTVVTPPIPGGGVMLPGIH